MALTLTPQVLRVFVESVLRYGLPINFDTSVVRANKGRSKTARKVLQTLFAHLDAAAGGRDVAVCVCVCVCV
jgi:V-type H+-transporting ATPase subunit C